jgi:hypothetical protein
MVECRACDRSIPQSANFCHHCGAPQNEEAAAALEEFASENAPSGSGSVLLDRLGYALGWLVLVVGLALLPSVGGAFVVVGGVFALPPVRRLFERLFGQQIDQVPMLGSAIFLSAIGGGLYMLL